MKFGQKYFVKQQSELGKLNGHIEEVFSGQNIVKAFNGQHKVSEQFDKTNTELFKSAQMSQFLSSSMMPIMDFTNKLTYVFIMALGAYLCSTGVISPGIIISFISYMNMFQQPMMQIGQLMGSLQTASAAAERVGEFLAETEQVDDSHIANKIDPKKVKGAVSFKHVRFGYLPGKIIIKDFSLEVKAGQKIAIVGPTGAGKTTLVNLIMRFYELNSGSISVDGVDTATLKRKDVRRLFSMVLQDT
jgi:ATP-binding cassette subfamily B protein